VRDGRSCSGRLLSSGTVSDIGEELDELSTLLGIVKRVDLRRLALALMAKEVERTRARNNQASANCCGSLCLLLTTKSAAVLLVSSAMDTTSFDELLTCICGKVCTTISGLTRHQNASGHAPRTSADADRGSEENEDLKGSIFVYHPFFTGRFLV
jgi:hypothetical protein